MKHLKLFSILFAASFTMIAFTRCDSENNKNGNRTCSDVIDSLQFQNSKPINVAYVDIDTLLSNYDFWKAINKEMIRKEENIRATLNEKAKDLQADYEDFQRKLQNNAYSTRERAEEEQGRIMKKKDDLDKLQEKLSSDLVAENQKNSIMFRDSINSYLKEFNKEGIYNMIISRVGDNLLYADPSMNITNEVLKGLNARYNAGLKK